MKHDKYKEGRLAQLSDRHTITLNWFAVSHQLAKVGDSWPRPPHSETNVGDMHANARFFGLSRISSQHHRYVVPLPPGHRKKG